MEILEILEYKISKRGHWNEKKDNYVIYVSAELFAFEFWISLNDQTWLNMY